MLGLCVCKKCGRESGAVLRLLLLALDHSSQDYAARAGGVAAVVSIWRLYSRFICYGAEYFASNSIRDAPVWHTFARVARERKSCNL
ncbi:hypothetical protein TSAR_008675 [Trichomalopsis sarcophagae]|uniref:Uncharacterized protein n=1 Tax=Trichomalopsis sarcophagae TaxID=543379 RepID=A0A232EQY7_9HYME|nr:hypothetical protein TSAR_008675 [Trichomalopsis sarcophagae]